MSLYDTLFQAAEKGQVNRVKIIIDRGIPVDAKTDGGVTALMIAASNGRIEVVKLLVAKGADIDVRNERGITPLMAGAMGGSLEVVKELLDKGADLNAKDKRRRQRPALVDKRRQQGTDRTPEESGEQSKKRRCFPDRCGSKECDPQ